MTVYTLTEDQLWEIQEVARADERSGEAWPLSFDFENTHIESIFEEFKGTTGWRGLDPELAIECFIRYIKGRKQE